MAKLDPGVQLQLAVTYLDGQEYLLTVKLRQAA